MKVILEGCNGDWAQKRYFPMLIKEAAKGKAELRGIDIEAERYLNDSPEIELAWEVARNNNAYYLNKVKEGKFYENLSGADYVFLVAPDQFHSEIAEFWLERLAPGGRIFIEKPLDAFVRAALKLKKRVEEKKDIVFAFDHYLARARPFLQDKERYFKEIGGIKKIKFHILECFGIPPNRVKALDKGMIFDLFCHVLALVSAMIDRNLTPSETILQTVKLEEVKAAQYLNCPISGETFAWIKFLINSIEIESAVGKSVGTQEDKSMVIYGSRGQIKLDLLKDKFFVFDHQGNKQNRGNLNPNHVESFLEEILQGKDPLSSPGMLSFDAAFEILTILDEAKMRIGKMPEYQVGGSIIEILKSF